jgi:serine/threonine-protein kinase
MRADLERARTGQPVVALVDGATRVLPVVPASPQRHAAEVPFPDDERWIVPARWRRGFMPWMVPSLIVAVLLLAAVVGARSQPRLVTVPDLLSQSVEAATALLKARGLALHVAEESYDAAVPAGAIIWQEPETGAGLQPGLTVAVGVSLGPEMIAVPNLLGRSEEEAGRLLTEAGLALAGVQRAASTVIPAGEVLGQTPSPGAELLRGSEVGLVVSAGPPPAALSAPVMVLPPNFPANVVMPAGPAPAVQPARKEDQKRGRGR